MTVNKRGTTTSRRERGAASGYLIGLAFSLAAFLIISLLFSLASFLFGNPLGIVGVASMAALVLSAAVSGIGVTKLGGGFGRVMLTALGVVLIMLIASLTVFGGGASVSGLLNYAIYIGVTAFSAYVVKAGIGKRRKSSFRRRRR